MGNEDSSKYQDDLYLKKIFSVIIPAYQEERLIENILKQFNPELKNKHNIELIVSDGGSTDKTLMIASKYADLLIENKTGQRQNISIGRNIGAKHAKGNILIFVNADTIIPDIDKFFSSIKETFLDSKVIAITFPVFIYPQEENVVDKIFHIFLNIYFFALNVLGIGMGRGECQVVRREMFNEIGGYNETISAGEDFDLYRRLRRLGKIKFLWKQKIYESPRRYRRYGYIKIIIIWLLNAISVLFKNKSIHKEWKPIR